MEGGIPELDLTGPYAIMLNKVISPNSGAKVGYVFVKPISEEIAAINGFYNEERNRTNLLLWVTLIASIIEGHRVEDGKILIYTEK
jgi:hypothetical protein